MVLRFYVARIVCTVAGKPARRSKFPEKPVPVRETTPPVVLIPDSLLQTCSARYLVVHERQACGYLFVALRYYRRPLLFEFL